MNQTEKQHPSDFDIHYNKIKKLSEECVVLAKGLTSGVKPLTIEDQRNAILSKIRSGIRTLIVIGVIIVLQLTSITSNTP